MTYTMLLWPHANARYQNESVKLALSELRLMADVFAPDARVETSQRMNLPALDIILPEEGCEDFLAEIPCHSLMYALFEVREDGLFRPVSSRNEAYIGADLPGVLKYKGKTNDRFLELLMNTALYSGGFARKGSGTLELLDPMCGRATTLFVAANRGWNSTGIDVDRNDLNEAEKYLKRYFEYHHMKYELTRESRTLADRKSAPVTGFCFSDSTEHFKKGDTTLLRLAHARAEQSRQIFGKEKFHMIVCDLPYGIQHAGVGGSCEELLVQALPAWRESLKKGGTVAVSFNAQTFKTEKVRKLFEEAGLEVCTGGPYDGFEHWVEQAITRDIVVGRRVS